jgi:hypothetical protein
LRDNSSGIKMALLNRSKETGQHRVRLGSAFGSIAAADLPRDHGWTERVFGAPVGRVDRIRFEKKGEDRWEFDGEMGRESTRNVCGARAIDEHIGAHAVGANVCVMP